MNKEAFEKRWNVYFAAYAATDPAERQRLLNQCVSEDVVFTNPGGEGQSRASLHSHIGAFQLQMPGMRFSTDHLLVHHGELLAVWSMLKPNSTKVATGYNFVRPDRDGLFSYMAGFF
jgi:hypothetical protein